MKKLILLFVFGAISSVNGQVVFDQSDFVTVGTTITYGLDDDVSNLTLDLGTSGSGQSFDFSNLQTDELMDVGFYDPASVQGGADFPSADMAIERQMDEYDFINVSSSQVEVTGFSYLFFPPTYESIPAENNHTLMEFPASINSPILVDTAVFDGDFYSDGLIPSPIAAFWDPDSVRIKRVVYYENEVVGEGILTDVLANNHNVLKMETVESVIDTMWGWTAGDGWEQLDPVISALIGIESESTVYRTRYISKDLGYYVVDVTTEANGTPISAKFLSDQSLCCTTVTGVDNPQPPNQIVYPNPSIGLFRLQTGMSGYEEVFDALGQRIFYGDHRDNAEIDLTSFPDGVYTIRLMSGTDQAVQRLVKKSY